IDMERTITEFIGVPDDVKDDLYLLNLSISNLKNDASPSRPVLFSIFY
ncbi:MAG: metal-dependent hydrolase, partial [Crocinitomicaceae bacterium]|nr:metal-dependent hydrolase [Crocinitomicaceae bacterium]